MIAENFPPEPNGSRRKRTRLTEEDLIERRQAHDMEIEKRRAALEEKEKRIYEEGKRRDELSATQLDLRKDQIQLQQQLLEQQKLPGNTGSN
ncbi:unnamed protein product [Allacma fusca]|uniref:Uncharacterized protein n=1 Tax=Allacma fusca TaxID=39272 RepID=A0A8J2JUJ4_9HEXA|nr:unnamed protein product [Allacma fusca]